MNHFLIGVFALLHLYGPYVLGSLLPTLISGLMLSPKTAPEAAWLVKYALNPFKHLMDFLSLATFKDESGTWQPPFKLDGLVKKIPPAALMIFAMWGLGTLAILFSSCGWWSANKAQLKSVAIDCSKQAILTEVANLLPAVMAVLSGSASDWESQLHALETVGGEALACAVQRAQHFFAEPAARPATSEHSTAWKQGYERSQKYIAKRHWAFLEGM